MTTKRYSHKIRRFVFFSVFGTLLFFQYTGNGVIKLDTASAEDTVTTRNIVNVALSEWLVTPDKRSIPAGRVRFSVRNDGPVDQHEFVIFKTNLRADSLPSDAKGVDENGSGLTLIGEIEGIRVGTTAHSSSFDLTPGNYVLVCNIWDANEQESHYHEGMRVRFTVN